MQTSGDRFKRKRFRYTDKKRKTYRKNKRTRKNIRRFYRRITRCKSGKDAFGYSYRLEKRILDEKKDGKYHYGERKDKKSDRLYQV